MSLELTLTNETAEEYLVYIQNKDTDKDEYIESLKHQLSVGMNLLDQLKVKSAALLKLNVALTTQVEELEIQNNLLKKNKPVTAEVVANPTLDLFAGQRKQQDEMEPTPRIGNAELPILVDIEEPVGLKSEEPDEPSTNKEARRSPFAWTKFHLKIVKASMARPEGSEDRTLERLLGKFEKDVMNLKNLRQALKRMGIICYDQGDQVNTMHWQDKRLFDQKLAKRIRVEG